MCSIAGLYTWDKQALKLTQRRAFAATALVAGESRGPHSGGVFTGLKLLKRVGRPSEFAPEISTTALTDFGDEILLVHTRYGTHGKLDLPHAHPFALEDGAVMMHNGVVDGPKVDGYPYQTDLDSELLGAQILRNGLEAAAKAISGGAAIAIWTPAGGKAKHGTLMLYRDSNPLVIAQFDGGMAFASTYEQLHAACNAAGIVPYKEGSLPNGYGVKLRLDRIIHEWKHVLMGVRHYRTVTHLCGASDAAKYGATTQKTGGAAFGDDEEETATGQSANWQHLTGRRGYTGTN